MAATQAATAKIQMKFAICSSQWVIFWAVSRLSDFRIVTCPASCGILVREIADEPEPVAQLEDERPDVEDDVAVRRVHRLRVAVQHLDELLLREHGSFDERVLDSRPGEKVLRRRAHEALGEAGDRAREGLEVRRQLGLERSREVDVRERIGHLGRHRLLNRRIGDQLLRGLLELARVERLALDVRREDAEDQQQHAEDEEDAGGDDAAARRGSWLRRWRSRLVFLSSMRRAGLRAALPGGASL